MESQENNEIYDVIIIGGGPAGLTAGIYASRAKMKTVLLEKALAGGQIAGTGHIENYPGFKNISGYELAQRMEEHAKEYDIEIRLCGVSEINRCPETGLFVVKTCSGDILGRTIILTTGVHPRKMGIPGEEEFRGQGVSYCAICDGFFYNGKKVAVIGGGDSAVEEGIYLTKFADKVFIVHRRDQLRAQKILQERAKSNPKVEFVLDSVPLEVLGDETGVTGLRIQNVKTKEIRDLSVDGVFVYIGTQPNTFVTGLNMKTDEMGFVITDDKMMSSIEGIFVAGDVRSKPLRQIVTAIADGAIAATFAEKYIDDFQPIDKIIPSN